MTEPPETLMGVGPGWLVLGEAGRGLEELTLQVSNELLACGDVIH